MFVAAAAVSASLRIQVPVLARFLPALPVHIRAAEIDQAGLNVTFQNNKLSVSGDGTFPSVDIGLPNNARIKSNLTLDKVSFSLAESATTPFTR